MVRTDYIGAITYMRRKHVRTHGALSGFTYESIYSNLWNNLPDDKRIVEKSRRQLCLIAHS